MVRLRRLCAPALLFVAACVSGAAGATEPAPAVEVTADPHGASGLIRGAVDIDAPPATVWRVLVDCAGAPRLMVNLKSCRILRRDPGGRWDEREQISRGGLLPGVRTVVHADYEPTGRIDFHSIAGDLKLLQGEWRLQSLAGGARTRVLYESRVTASFIAPGPLVRTVLRRDMPKTLANLRDACEARAGSLAEDGSGVRMGAGGR
ncbi:SRPBCC family protein [Phenylobacterium montanum]|uniref:SRPBCC family protein n=1 Tax=Phenylobacterium montanum TaxID=2823693 RepID=A0A975ITL7_9CAUL|nr:SRPBCC family protein [Caulobacter sp. S6]QUD87002.1 SRPBCC family protein [Caulobacter sp. S6]